jgi:hypothetical protein
MSTTSDLAALGFRVVARSTNQSHNMMPREEKPVQRTGQLPKIPTKPGKPMPAPKQKGPVVPKPALKKPLPKYGKMANSRAAGLLKLAIKWAQTAPDPETKKVLIAGVKALKGLYWSRLSDKSKEELNSL